MSDWRTNSVGVVITSARRKLTGISWRNQARLIGVKYCGKATYWMSWTLSTTRAAPVHGGAVPPPWWTRARRRRRTSLAIQVRSATTRTLRRLPLTGAMATSKRSVQPPMGGGEPGEHEQHDVEIRRHIPQRCQDPGGVLLRPADPSGQAPEQVDPDRGHFATSR